MYPNGITITNTYDSLNRLTSTTSKKPDGTSVITGEYKYDAAGNVRYVSQVSSSHTQVVENTYDDFDRLTTENITLDNNLNDIRQKVYSYDNADNCTSYMEYRYNNVWDGNIYYYNSLNQMYSDYAYPGIKGTCIYDEFGNYISKAYEYPDESTSISSNNEYDGFGRLKVDGTTTYNYDYRGRLVSSINASNGTYRYKGSYSGGTSVIDKNSGNTTYIYRGSDMGGGVGGLLYAENADNSGLNYKHYNLRGDIVATTDSECSILVQYLYEAFGAIIETYGISPSDRYRSNTKYRDGYINEGRRWRTTSATGFISPDPLEYIDGLNCYIYCGNNPWGRFDPYGLDWAVQNYPRSPQKEMRDGGIWHRKVNPGVPNIWIAFLGSCDTPVNIDKDFIAVQIDIVVKDFDGKIKLKDSVVVANKISKENTTEKNGERYVNNLKIKGFLQDEGNYMNIVSNEDEIEISVRPALYSGSPNDYGFYETDVTVADWDDKQHEYYGDIKNQTQDKWSAYSQTKNDSHDKKFISKSAKTLDQIKDKNGNAPKAKDIAKSPTTSKIDAF